MDEYLDTMTNEIEQGFQQKDGWKSCRHLLGKLIKELDEQLLEAESTIDALRLDLENMNPGSRT